MRDFLISLLSCPECKSADLKIKSVKRENDEIVSGEFHCSCGAIYPIISGIPRFLKSHRLDITSKDSIRPSQVQKMFEYQWKKWGKDKIIFGRSKEETRKFFLGLSG